MKRRIEYPLAAPPGFAYRVCACGAFFHALLVDETREFFGLECASPDCGRVMDSNGYPMKAELPKQLPETKGACTMWGKVVRP